MIDKWEKLAGNVEKRGGGGDDSRVCLSVTLEDARILLLFSWAGNGLVMSRKEMMIHGRL